MENETFRSRIAKLLQKSRKALRLYSSMARVSGGKNIEFTEMQVQEWKDINAELLKRLSEAMQTANSKKFVADVFSLRDRFYSEWRMHETDLHSQHKELIYASENGDFIKAANISRELVALKARVQAAQAAHHEIQDVIDRSRISQPAISLSQEQVVSEEEPEFDSVEDEPKIAKVIPLRKRGA